MGKTGKWFKSFLTGKKDQKTSNVGVNHKHALADTQNPTTPVVIPMPNTPKEKRRWSFRRSSATVVGPKDPNPVEVATVVGPKDPNLVEVATAPPPPESEAESEDATVVEAQAVEEAIQLTSSSSGSGSVIEEAAAIKIQSVFRSYLARKALKALRGLVKLQAIVRGHLVRKQATTTLRCMQALAIAQARARAQRIRTVEDGMIMNHMQSTHRRNDQEKINHSYHDMEENIKIVEMDHGEFRSNCKSRNNYSVSSQQQQQSSDKMDNRMSTYYSSQQRAYSKQDYQHISPAPSVITDMSPRNYSGHFDDYSFATAQSSPQCYSTMSKPDQSSTMFAFPRPDYAETMSYDYPLYPNYMANTESSRAKARSQSAPKQRPELERQPSRGRRASVEGRGIPRGARMQRSSSHVGSTAQNYHYPCSIKLDKSTLSLKDSECGSTCSVLTNANYSRSVVSYGPRYY